MFGKRYALQIAPKKKKSLRCACVLWSKASNMYILLQRIPSVWFTTTEMMIPIRLNKLVCFCLAFGAGGVQIANATFRVHPLHFKEKICPTILNLIMLDMFYNINSDGFPVDVDHVGAPV